MKKSEARAIFTTSDENEARRHWKVLKEVKVTRKGKKLTEEEYRKRMRR